MARIVVTKMLRQPSLHIDVLPTQRIKAPLEFGDCCRGAMQEHIQLDDVKTKGEDFQSF
jgi:hypothetical protein